MIAVVTASTLIAYVDLHRQPGDRAEVPHRLARADAAVPALRHLPLPLSGAPEGGRRQPVRHAAERSAAARLRGALGDGGRVIIYGRLTESTRHGQIQQSPSCGRRPATVLRDYHSLMNLAGYQDVVAQDADTALKVNISWHFFFPGSSTTPWQLDGVIRAMKQRRLRPER